MPDGGEGQPTTALADSLRPEQVGPRQFRFRPPPEGRGVVFGGHLLAQMMMATSRLLADTGKPETVKSAHGVFARTVNADLPCEVTVDLLHGGRVLSSATAAIWQQGSERARALVMLSAAEPDLIRHQADPPQVGTPDDAPAIDDVLGREVRVVGGIDRGDPDVVRPPDLAVWVRYPAAPKDPGLRQALLAHGTAGFLMGTTMLPHPGIGERMAHRAFSTGIVAHSVSFHEPVDPADWLLLSQQSSHAGNGRAYGVGRVFDTDGVLVASFNQEAIMRPFPDGHAPQGREATIL